MYTPPHFAQKDLGAALEVIAREPFGMLVSTVEGEPAITHLPFSIVQTEPHVVLSAHMAKANPHWRALGGAGVVVVFRGVHGYISPRWYGDPKRDVPTWNYVAVHVHGTVRIAPDREKAAIVGRLSDQMEADSPEPWSAQMLDPDYFRGQAQGIVAFYVDASQIDATFKLSQNRRAADRDGAIRGLRAAGSENNLNLAAEMTRFGERG